jgi:hypothetical protein
MDTRDKMKPLRLIKCGLQGARCMSQSKNLIGIIWDGNALSTTKEAIVEKVDELQSKSIVSEIPGMESPHTRYRNKLAGKNVFMLNFLHENKSKGDGKNLALAKSIGAKNDANASLTDPPRKILNYASKRGLISAIICNKSDSLIRLELKNASSGLENVYLIDVDKADDFMLVLEAKVEKIFGKTPRVKLLVVSDVNDYLSQLRAMGFLTCRYRQAKNCYYEYKLIL